MIEYDEVTSRVYDVPRRPDPLMVEWLPAFFLVEIRVFFFERYSDAFLCFRPLPFQRFKLCCLEKKVLYHSSNASLTREKEYRNADWERAWFNCFFPRFFDSISPCFCIMKLFSFAMSEASNCNSHCQVQRETVSIGAMELMACADKTLAVVPTVLKIIYILYKSSFIGRGQGYKGM